MGADVNRVAANRPAGTGGRCLRRASGRFLRPLAQAPRVKPPVRCLFRPSDSRGATRNRHRTGGSHPQPEAACAALADIDPTVFDPVPPNQACTQIFGGPETATVSGTWNGDAVDAAFARNNGCEIARWEAAVEVLAAGAATASST